jgi:murein DD-endopeptidase MepM/ murein hydrolase activator NlpD
VLLVLAVACAMAFAGPSAAQAESGGAGLVDPGTTGSTGTTGPTSTSPSGGAGDSATARRQAHAQRRRAARPVLASFRVSETTVLATGTPPTVTYRVNDRSRYVRVRLALVQLGRGALRRYNLGRRRTGRSQTFTLSTADARRMAPGGTYKFRLTAVDPDGNRLVRSSRKIGAAAPAPAPVGSRDHRFPVLGSHDFGGVDSRFGAPRTGHTHEGQDIAAAQGTPVVAPYAGVIIWRAYQASGAGYYLVLAGNNEAYNYVFMHLQQGSMLVNKGDAVTAGQQIANVGNTGGSEGPHLHFEIWNGPWYHGGKPIDPLPLLLAWDAYS